MTTCSCISYRRAQAITVRLLTARDSPLRAFSGSLAVLIYGYDYDVRSMNPAVEAFEQLAMQRVRLGPREVASFDGLIHPVHRRGASLSGKSIAWAPNGNTYAMQFLASRVVQVRGGCRPCRPNRIDRDCPLDTARDRCLWHAGGTAGQNDDAPTWRQSSQLDPRVRPFLGEPSSWARVRKGSRQLVDDRHLVDLPVAALGAWGTWPGGRLGPSAAGTAGRPRSCTRKDPWQTLFAGP